MANNVIRPQHEAIAAVITQPQSERNLMNANSYQRA